MQFKVGYYDIILKHDRVIVIVKLKESNKSTSFIF